MITPRKAEDRGRSRFDWLDSRHSFSFGRYQDPAHTGFRSLLVLNDDRVAPGGGFPTHGHDNMEILSYVLEGTMRHKDSMGNGSVIRPGELQYMSAGSGVRHSEFNDSADAPLHFYQIWIQPNRRDLEPRYDQVAIDAARTRGSLALVAAPDAPDGAISLRQDARLYLARLDATQTVEHTVDPGRHAWLQVLSGAVTLNDLPLREGDGAAVSDESRLVIAAPNSAEILLFDLA
jgi:quercetin 2,3-dioxygenase